MENFRDLIILDCVRRGNVLRLFLGDPALRSWHGDDWDDAPYEHNAGVVYDGYVSRVVDAAVPFDLTVLEPADDWSHKGNSPWSKDDMRARRVPMLLIGKDEDGWRDWRMLADRPDTIRVHMGDPASVILDVPGVLSWV
ncbi:hypothetical protein [Bifidobacterium sp. SO1]|uniref:hypothetical protein n=1 Tax=Bifidobacterium sp. SO1 TaxID=2809029 RepID=UPI001BDCA764|nr:hypothetical protein [Bifidobacterium sp. SO1]MBT1161715.1 hypothetical protein [Bifidobacterium sp. SO1]